MSYHQQLDRVRTDPDTAVTVVRDGDTIATLSHDGTVRLWQPKRRPHSRIAAHNDWVRSAVFSPVPGQRLVLSASADGTGRIWDLQSGLLRLELRGHPVPEDKQWGPLWWLTPTGWSLAIPEVVQSLILSAGGVERT